MKKTEEKKKAESMEYFQAVLENDQGEEVMNGLLERDKEVFRALSSRFYGAIDGYNLGSTFIMMDRDGDLVEVNLNSTPESWSYGKEGNYRVSCSSFGRGVPPEELIDLLLTLNLLVTEEA